MSKLKDKLSASMRVVKSSQQSDAVATTDSDAGQPVAKSAMTSAQPVSSARGKNSALAGDVPPSGSAQFPARVWPD